MVFHKLVCRKAEATLSWRYSSGLRYSFGLRHSSDLRCCGGGAVLNQLNNLVRAPAFLKVQHNRWSTSGARPSVDTQNNLGLMLLFSALATQRSHTTQLSTQLATQLSGLARFDGVLPLYKVMPSLAFKSCIKKTWYDFCKPIS